MRTTKITYSLALLCFALLYPWLCIRAQITGPVSIVPGNATQYYWSHFGYGSPEWSAPFGTFNATNITNPLITISKNVNTPSVQLKVVSKDVTNPSQTLTEYKTVEVDPFIKGPTTISPGESITLVNQDNREGYTGHNACYWNWSVSNSAALTCGGNCNNSLSNSVVFTCPTSAPQAYYTISCTKYCGGGAYAYTSQIRVDVVSSNPSNPSNPNNPNYSLPTPIIQGPSEVNCNIVMSNLIYTVNNLPPDTYYEWQLPPHWGIVGNTHTNSISVVTSPMSMGFISVKGYTPRGDMITSPTGYLGVNCCLETITVVNGVPSGNTDNREANYSVIASNTINSGATARYHGGSFVNLSTGFSAVAESNVHMYPEGCTSVYQRMSGNGGSISEDGTSILDKSSTTPFSLRPDDQSFDFEVFPNPTDRSIKIVLDKNKELPESIRLTDILGNEVKLISGPSMYEYEFDLADYSRGVYLLNVQYAEKNISRKIIRN